uniref:Uncharacterized protein n=1 Tax=Rhizophora mucronata TaxID=61149 RepID=A0A2P2QLX6_RHIMU
MLLEGGYHCGVNVVRSYGATESFYRLCQ